MGRQQRGRLFRIAVPILAGAILGTIGAVGYAAVCGAIAWLLTGSGDQFLPWAIRFGVAGPIAGTVMGVCLAIDWSRNGDEARQVTASAKASPKTPLESDAQAGARTRLQPYWQKMRLRG